MYLELNNIDPMQVFPGYTCRFIHSESMTMAYFEVEAGAAVPEHSHHNEQVSNILEGEFELTIEGETRILTPGVVAVIPRNARHSGRAVTNCRILDIFQPVREDYQQLTASN